jgi:ribosomal protein L11
VSPGAGAPVEQLADAIAQEADEPVSVNVQVIEAESATVDVEEPPTDQPPPPETAVPVRTDE